MKEYSTCEKKEKPISFSFFWIVGFPHAIDILLPITMSVGMISETIKRWETN